MGAVSLIQVKSKSVGHCGNIKPWDYAVTSSREAQHQQQQHKHEQLRQE